jgi:transcription-repair coupling factor (superfamily II helicase)
VREVAVARDVIRLAPLQLKASQTIRLQRLYPKAVYKEDLGQIVLPLPKKTNAAEHVRGFLGAIVPDESGDLAS